MQLRWTLPLLTLAAMPAWAQGVIKIGEINSYKAQPAFLEPYKKAWSWPWSRSMPQAALQARSCS